MITGWCEVLGELVPATAATGANSRAITAAAAVMSFPFRDIPASPCEDRYRHRPYVDHLASLGVIARSVSRSMPWSCRGWPRQALRPNGCRLADLAPLLPAPAAPVRGMTNRSRLTAVSAGSSI